MSIRNFKEDYLFMKYKDAVIGNAEKFRGLVRKKYKDVDSGELYRKIVNYQVKKYGGCLSGDGEIKNNKIKRRHI